MEEQTQEQQQQNQQVAVSSEQKSGGEKRSPQGYFLPASILIAGILISGSVMYLVGTLNGSGGKVAQITPLSEETQNPPGVLPEISTRDVILGDPNAPVAVVEYGDYQCPFCGKFFEESEQAIREQYVKSGKVKMIFRNFQFLGPESVVAAEAAECAKDQSQFWAYHDALYTAEIADGQEHNGNLDRKLFVKLAENLKLDTKAFASCFDAQKYTNQIKEDIANAQAAGINSTPIVFVNGKKFVGALPFEQFKQAIDEALAQ